MCAAYRIRHSEFLAWSESDRDKAISYHIWEGSKCGGCRTRPKEWDPEQGGHREAYRAVPLQCDGCQRRERAEQDLAKSKNPPAGMHIALIKNEEV